MLSVRRIFSILAVISIIVAAAPAVSYGKILTELDRIAPRELAVGGFVLNSKQKVSIEAVGFRYRSHRHDARFSSAWILDAETREAVWELADADSEKKSRHLREYHDKITLPRGRYEVYYSSFPHSYRNDWDVDSFGDFISGIFHGFGSWDFDYDDYRRACREFSIVVSGDGESRSRDEIESFHDELRKDALVSVTGIEENRYESIGLNLDKKTDLEIYAIGEMRRDGEYDCSWIVDTETHKRVWEFDYHNSDPAGGAKKNRMSKDDVTLPAGSYAVFCVTDDSHHAGDWNTSPPDDPFFWGLTIKVADSKMKKHARTSEYENIDRDRVIVELVGLGDSDYQNQGFSLKKDMKLRLYAIGEGDDGDMYDYGWIMDADSREIVWEMDYYDSDHAGGAKKNRLVDVVVELDKGDYVACAATDGSHSCDEWNAAPPYDRVRWGLTVMLTGGSSKDVAEYDEKDDESVLTSIVGVGDDERKRERFTLDRDAKVRIYALGEGTGGHMHDYAWIEDARTGRVVWEMTYRMTDHAGGARKNRVFDGTVSLDAGEYVVFYESDGSHSFDGWNARPPADRWNWGVTVRTDER